MKMTVFHGSSKIIERPYLGGGSPYNDFGPGFYCTDDWALAAEWACKRGEDGFVNEYTLDCENLNILDLLNGEFTVLNWIALLMAHRKFTARNAVAAEVKRLVVRLYLPETSGFDLIIGYRADDSYFSYAEDFVENSLPVQELGRALKLGNLGEQIVLVSQLAHDALCFVDAMPVAASEFFPRFNARDVQARTAYEKKIKGSINFQKAIFATDILRGAVKFDDKRIPRMLSGNR